MKRLISIAIAAATIVTLGTGSTLAWQNNLTASACQVQNCSQTAAHPHNICTVSDCTQSFNHEHGGIVYYAHHENDGHIHMVDTAAVMQAPFKCDISGCLKTDEHTHTVCTVENCNETSDHSHNGMIYFGHNDSDGHNHSRQNAMQDNGNAVSAYNCGVSGCNKTATHSHTNCTVSGCNQTGNHTHNSCGISGCDNTGGHHHKNNNSGGHKPKHGGGHH